MADQDELVQVGFETTILEEFMAQDDSFEGDCSLLHTQRKRWQP